MPAGWIGQKNWLKYMACTVIKTPEFWFCLASEVVRSSLACFSSNRNLRDSTKYKPTPDSVDVDEHLIVTNESTSSSRLVNR
jgi:hypothetical protein